MKKADPLHQLIKSLTPNEKRFFKILASRHVIGNKSNYVKLFESIAKLNPYDEEKLKKNMSKEIFAGHISTAKNQLYNLILECLEFFHRDVSVNCQISKYINVASVLSSKKLDEQSLKLIDKALKLSLDHNRLESVILLVQYQKNARLSSDTLSVEELHKYYEEIFSAVKLLNTNLEFNKIRDELFLQRRIKCSVKNEEEHKNLNLFYDNPYFRDFSRINSMNANMYYLLAKIEFAITLRNRNMGRLYAKKLISLFELNVSLILDNVNLYISVFSNFIGGRFYLNNRNEANSMLEKMIAIPILIGKKAMTYALRVKIFESYYASLTDVALNFKDYEGTIPLIEKAEGEINKFAKWMTPTLNLVIKSNIASIYFGARNFKQSLKWCNAALNCSTLLREDIFYQLRILNILIHFELGNELILPGLIKSTYRYLYKRKMVYKFENLFLEYFRLLLRSETKQEQIILFIQFREKLIPLLANNLENVIFDDIDIIDWINRKIK